jgi:NHL repeat/Immunoglobulin I-set domain/ZU5 domain
MSFRCHSMTSAARGAVHMLAAALCAALVACGGGGSAPLPSVGQATIDAAGGTVEGPDGVQLVVPEAALASATTLRIARDATGAPELGGAKAISPVYAVTPHGTAFAESARISIPFSPEDVAPGTQPVILKSQPGGNWQVLPSQTSGNRVSAADTDSLSFYAVGTCFITREVSVGGPDPLFYCPGAHDLTLVLLDGSGAEVPVPRRSDGTPLPAATISEPQTLRYELRWTRPAGVSRLDSVSMTVLNAGLTGAQQPLVAQQVNGDFNRVFQTQIDPATVPNASTSRGGIVTLVATVSYTQDAFYLGCACFRPATWSFESRIPVRVVYTGIQPVITQQPQNRNVVAGQTAAFSVTATGANLSYQWSSFRGQNQSVLFGATQSSHTTPATTLGDDNTFFAVDVCSNRGTAQQRCINSDAAVLRVTQTVVAPTFSQAPQSISVQSGQTASFSATASGQPAPTITWARVTSAPGAFFVTFDPICASTAGSGTQTSATCTIGPLSQADNGMRIFAQASNDGGSINSPEAVVTVTAPPVAPSITSPAQPDDRTITAGQGVSWTVTASGTAPISFAWRTVSPTGVVNDGGVCDQSVPGSSRQSATLTLANVPLACNGYRFQAAASNGVVPEALSRQALLNVNPASAAPAITTALTNRSVNDGTSVTFSVAATGNPATFTYTWTLDGSAVPSPTSGCNASSASCTFTARLADTGKTIRVVVSNGTAPDATSQATLTVNAANPPGMVLFAGDFGGTPLNGSNGDGVGTAARFNEARGVVADTSGNLYVANRNGGWISKVTPGAVVTRIAEHGFSTSLGLGPDGSLMSMQYAGGTQANIRVLPPLQAGAATQARNCGSPICGGTISPNQPFLAVAPDERVFIAWQDANFISVTSGPLSAVNPQIAFLAGTTDLLNRPAGWVDGTGTDARFNSPSGIAMGPDGNLYVADTNNHVIRRVTPAGVVTTYAGTGTVAGSADGALLSARFNRPVHLGFDSDGALWVMEVGPANAPRAGLRRIAGGQVSTPVADLQAEIDTAAGGPSSSAVVNGFTRIYGGMAVIGPRQLAFTVTHALLVLTLP